MLSFVAAAYPTSRPTPFVATQDGSLSFSPCTAPQMESWDGKTAPFGTRSPAVAVAVPSSPCSSTSFTAPSLRSSPSSSSLASTAPSSLFSAAESSSSRSSTPEPIDLSSLDCPGVASRIVDDRLPAFVAYVSPSPRKTIRPAACPASKRSSSAAVRVGSCAPPGPLFRPSTLGTSADGVTQMPPRLVPQHGSRWRC
ncbi:hypothetical protein JCM10207_006716 [Rhodosporidiobolus poonsookiae]